MEDTERHALSQRLRRIEGQARGIQKMLADGAEASALLIQLMALQHAARAAATALVKAQATERIRAQIRTALASCPGSCNHCDELEAVDRALDELDLDALVQAHLKLGE